MSSCFGGKIELHLGKVAYVRGRKTALHVQLNDGKTNCENKKRVR